MTTIQEISTKDLIDILRDVLDPPIPINAMAIGNELYERLITDEHDTNKGGVRPDHTSNP